MTTADYRRRQREIEAWNARMAWRLLVADCALISLGVVAICWVVFK